MKRNLVFLALIFGLVLGGGLAAQDTKPELTMAFLTFGPNPADLQVVQDALNVKLAAKIGATVKLTPINIGAWGQQTNLMLASGEKLDLMIDGTLGLFNFGTQVAKGQLLPLDDLLAKYGQGIVKSMDAKFLSAGKVAGKQYIIPTVRDFAGNYVFVMRKDIVDKLKIDTTKIKNLDDIERVLKQVKAAYPDLVPLVPQTAEVSLLDSLQTWDRIGGYLGNLMNFGATLKVVNTYETPEYKALLNRVRSWYQAGLILKDAATNKDDFSVYFKANKAFSFLAQGKPGFAEQESGMAGQPLVSAEYISPFTTTDNVVNFGWTIPRNSVNPEKAMQLLNLLYSDPEVYNLLVFGIEGKHYVKQADGTVDYPAGVNGGNAAYSYSPLGWQLGNQLQGYVQKGNSPTIWKDMATFNNRAVKSKALGFVFDATPVKNEVATTQNVLNAYRVGLESGVLDPDKTLPEFVSKLKAAGLDKIIAEKQKQLDAWAAANGVK